MRSLGTLCSLTLREKPLRNPLLLSQFLQSYRQLRITKIRYSSKKDF